MSIKVSQLIRRGVITVDASSTIRDAARVMADNNIGLLVVMDRGRMVGVVSERDVVRAVARGVDLSEPVINISTREVITIGVGASLYEAADLMHKSNIRHLVVVDESRNPVGVLSVRDVVGEVTRLRILAEQGALGAIEEQPIPHTD
ncbi:MAG: CBS domain-containing protein [Caldivirga sp.]